MTGRIWIPIACVVALGAADAGVRHFRTAAGAGAAAPGEGRPASAAVGDLHVLDTPLPLRPFEARDLDGHDASSNRWQGRYLLVNVWATWCTPCRDEIPTLVALQAAHQDRLQVLGVLEDQVTPDFARAFGRALDMNYPVVFSATSIQRAFPETLALPTSYLVDPVGRIVATSVGPVDVAAVARLIAGVD